MATYYAMTSTYPKRHNWQIVGVGVTPAGAQRDAETRLGTLGDAVRNHDIYRETELKNLTVKSMTRAIREGYVPRNFNVQEHPAWHNED